MGRTSQTIKDMSTKVLMTKFSRDQILAAQEIASPAQAARGREGGAGPRDAAAPKQASGGGNAEPFAHMGSEFSFAQADETPDRVQHDAPPMAQLWHAVGDEAGRTISETFVLIPDGKGPPPPRARPCMAAPAWLPPPPPAAAYFAKPAL